MALVPLDQARALVLGKCPPVHPAAVALVEARGLVAASAVHAEEAVPPFDNSAMDGYAVRAEDTGPAPVVLQVVGLVAAGSVPEVVVGPGEAVRIMTGAPMPGGADAVVMVESTVASADGSTVEIAEAVAPGGFVRRAGDDLRPGDTVVDRGTILNPGLLGVLASLGVRRVPVYRRVRVGVLSTGDELFDGPGPLAPGRIRDSNRPMLLALVAEAGGDPVDLGHAPDDEGAIREAVERGVGSCDAVLTSGGVSMGDFDLVKVVLDRIGEMTWMQVAIKPAKPFAFGVVAGVPVFGLAGNPVSSMIGFELFARPALRQMMGVPTGWLDRPRVAGVAEDDLRRRPDGKTHFVRVVAEVGADGRYRARSAGGQGSHQLAAMAASNALAVLPDGDGVGAGETVELLLLNVR